MSNSRKSPSESASGTGGARAGSAAQISGSLSKNAALLVSDLQSSVQASEKKLKAVKRLRSTISSTLDRIQRHGRPLAELTKLTKSLESDPAAPDLHETKQMLQRIKSAFPELRKEQESWFRTELQRLCSAQGLAFALMPDGYAVGPFAVSADPATERARLEYAKITVTPDLPYSPAAAVKRTEELTKQLLDPPSSISTLAEEVEEAIRVSLVRQRRSMAKEELRAGLPTVYREMTFIRQAKPGGSISGQVSYPVARFIVEITLLVRSDQNVNSTRRFRLETSVLENTKNPKKSLFFPSDLSRGYGEGTWYQAIVMNVPS